MATVQDLTTQLEQAKIDEKAAHIAAIEQQKRRDHELKEIERGAANELREVSSMAAPIFAAKATPASRPAPEIRALARQFLHGGLDVFAVEALANTDPTFGARFGISRRAGQLMIRFADVGVRDETLWTAADAIEAKLWGLAIARAEFLAGEAES